METELVEKQLTEQEMNLIVYALNQLFNDSHHKLEGHQLGDIERGMVEQTKKETKDLVLKIDRFITEGEIIKID